MHHFISDHSLWMTAALFCLLGLASTGQAQLPGGGALDPTRVLADALLLTGPAPQPASARRVKHGDKVAFIGDSITAAGGYVRLAEHVLATKQPELKLPPFINAGVGGQKAEDMAPRFAKDMQLTNHVAWTFINVGINDVWHRLGAAHDPAVLAAYETNVTKMVEEAQASGATAVLLTPTVIQELAEAEGNKRLALYVAAMQRVAAAKHCPLIDLHGMFLTALSHHPPTALTADGVHMRPYGDAIMAIGVLRALGPPDATIASVNTALALQLRSNGGTLNVQKLADLLQLPAARFAKPELASLFAF